MSFCIFENPWQSTHFKSVCVNCSPSWFEKIWHCNTSFSWSMRLSGRQFGCLISVHHSSLHTLRSVWDFVKESRYVFTMFSVFDAPLARLSFKYAWWSQNHRGEEEDGMKSGWIIDWCLAARGSGMLCRSVVHCGKLSACCISGVLGSQWWPDKAAKQHRAFPVVWSVYRCESCCGHMTPISCFMDLIKMWFLNETAPV